MITVNKANPTAAEERTSLVNASDGAGLHFDGSGVVAFTPVDLGSKFSHEFVLSTSEDLTTGTSSYIVDYHGSSDRFIIGAHPTQASGNLAIYDNTDWVSFGVNPLTDLKVHHIVVTVDGTSAVLYDNGNQVGTATISASHGIDSATNAGLAGYYNNSNNFEGTIYRARSYNRTLSADDVRTAYERADVDFKDQYGSQTETSTNSFTNVGFAGFSGSATGFTSTGSANGNSAYKNQTFTGGKKYRITFTVTDGESASNIFALRTGSNGSGANTGNYVSHNKGTLSAGDYPQLAIDETGDYEIIVDGLGSASSLRYAAIANLGAVDISGFSIVQIGCVTDYDLAFANENQSRMVADRSTNNVDGEMSSSGVKQTQVIKQLNSTAMRVGGTSATAATPADGDIIADKVGVGTAPIADSKLDIAGAGTQRLYVRETGSTVKTKLLTTTSKGAVGTETNHPLELQTNDQTRVTIDSSGNITTSSDGIALKLDGTSNTTRGIFIRNTGGSAHGYLHTDGNLKIIAEDAGKSINFYTADDGTGTARLTIASTGLATFNNGIAFSQTNSSATGATATGTTLDHYEEGTWTPVFSAQASSSGTWDTTLVGEYTRIGNLVTASMKITGTSMDFSSAAGYRTYSGLPFTGALKGAGAVSTAHAASFSGTTSTNVGANMTIIPAETGSGTSVVLAQATYRV